MIRASTSWRRRWGGGSARTSRASDMVREWTTGAAEEAGVWGRRARGGGDRSRGGGDRSDVQELAQPRQEPAAHRHLLARAGPDDGAPFLDADLKGAPSSGPARARRCR